MFFLGCDIGGTKCSIYGIDDHEKPIPGDWVETASKVHDGPKATVRQLMTALRGYCEKRKIGPGDIAAVGIDSPGPATQQGLLKWSANMHMHPEWDGFNVRAAVSSALIDWTGRNIPTVYLNDGDAACFWEASLADPKKEWRIIMLAGGTGIGGGFTDRGKPYISQRGATEFGHVSLAHVPMWDGMRTPICGCGKRGCAEAYASKAALEKNLLPCLLRMGQYACHPLAEIVGPEADARRANAVREMAAQGDFICRGLMLYQARRYGQLFAILQNAYDPDLMIMGGGFIETPMAGELCRDMEMERRNWAHPSKMDLPLKLARAGDRAGALGVALYAKRIHDQCSKGSVD